MRDQRSDPVQRFGTNAREQSYTEHIPCAVPCTAWLSRSTLQGSCKLPRQWPFSGSGSLSRDLARGPFRSVCRLLRSQCFAQSPRLQYSITAGPFSTSRCVKLGELSSMAEPPGASPTAGRRSSASHGSSRHHLQGERQQRSAQSRRKVEQGRAVAQGCSRPRHAIPPSLWPTRLSTAVTDYLIMLPARPAGSASQIWQLQ